jgi:hypothetical protein
MQQHRRLAGDGGGARGAGPVESAASRVLREGRRGERSLRESCAARFPTWCCRDFLISNPFSNFILKIIPSTFFIIFLIF